MVGQILSILIAPAERAEREGVKEMFDQSLCHHGLLRLLWVQGGFSGEGSAERVKSLLNVMEMVVVKRSDTAKGFKVLPRRGWLSGLFKARRG